MICTHMASISSKIWDLASNDHQFRFYQCMNGLAKHIGYDSEGPLWEELCDAKASEEVPNKLYSVSYSVRPDKLIKIPLSIPHVENDKNLTPGLYSFSIRVSLSDPTWKPQKVYCRLFKRGDGGCIAKVELRDLVFREPEPKPQSRFRYLDNLFFPYKALYGFVNGALQDPPK